MFFLKVRIKYLIKIEWCIKMFEEEYVILDKNFKIIIKLIWIIYLSRLNLRIF